MGVGLTEDEAWDLLAGHHTGIFTSLRCDGWPVSVPVWFVALDRRVHLWAPARTAKIRRVREDPRVCFLVEGGLAWAEVRAVLLTGTADLVEEAGERRRVSAVFGQKYQGFRMPEPRLPEATKRHYAGRPALIRITPTRPLTSWDNAKVRLREEER